MRFVWKISIAFIAIATLAVMPAYADSSSSSSSSGSYRSSSDCHYCKCAGTSILELLEDDTYGWLRTVWRGGRLYSTNCSALSGRQSGEDESLGVTFNEYTRCGAAYEVPRNNCSLPNGGSTTGPRCRCIREIKFGSGDWKNYSNIPYLQLVETLANMCKQQYIDLGLAAYLSKDEILEKCISQFEKVAYGASGGVVTVTGYSCSEADEVRNYTFREVGALAGAPDGYSIEWGERTTCFPASD